MANWATGTLKLRGTRENILKFCREQMKQRACSDKLPDRDKWVEWRIDAEDDEVLIATVHGEASLSIWLNDSQRNFVDMDRDVPYYWDMESDGDTHESSFNFWECPGEDSWCVVFPFMAAWGVDPDYYADLSKKYNIGFRIYTVEQGMGFFVEYSIKDGNVAVLNEGPAEHKDEKDSKHYGRFIWECPFPFLGG